MKATNNPEKLIQQVRAIINKRQLTHYRIAKLTGIARPNITRMLTEKQLPNLKTFCVLLEALNLDFQLSENKQDEKKT